ncbi:MAG: tetraacyldisaccharide 4'-kinase, partial [bacterium]|nr:tetraacyldisaccharide 4'-kinase [bacterium]
LNGSVSENTFKNWSRFSGVIRPLLNSFTFCFGKSQQDLKRLRALGVAEEKSAFEGNLKYAACPLSFDQDLLGQLKKKIGKRPVWLIASTHDGEEDLVVQAHKVLKKDFPDLLTLLAIRHPHRAEDVNLLLQGEGVTVSQRSLDQEITEKTDLYLIDTLGEMGLFYALSPIVCMGGTFGKVGGHNIIEPAQLDAAICFGPNMSNFQEVADHFVDLEAALRVKDVPSLVACVDLWLKEPTLARSISRQAKELSLTQGGVLTQILEKLEPYLPKANKEPLVKRILKIVRGHPPDFWWEKSPTFLALLLYPFSIFYRLGFYLKSLFSLSSPVGIPVICVGNVAIGGTGKTPLVLSILRILKEEGLCVHALTRGYGGSVPGPHLVDFQQDQAPEVGDESLLLAQEAPTWVAKNRLQGARAAVAGGANVIVMDDGFQNPSIKKDFSLVVVDRQRFQGNGLCLPAGPLRESWKGALKRVQGLVVMGMPEAEGEEQILESADLPVYCAHLVPRGEDWSSLKGKEVIAFAGIGWPEKFFNSMKEEGIQVIEAHSFPDHAFYNIEEIEKLAKNAKSLGVPLVTTEKDFVRLPEECRGKVLPLCIEVDIKQSDQFRKAIMDGIGPGDAI